MDDVSRLTQGAEVLPGDFCSDAMPSIWDMKQLPDTESSS